MKFTYQYHTKGNEIRRGTIAASNKDDVFARLKLQGIHPYNVFPAPGLWNRLAAIHRAWIVVVVLAGAIVGVLVNGRGRYSVPDDIGAIATDRHQIYGDPAVLADMEAAGYADIFADDLDRHLALYAIPGKPLPSGARIRRDLRVPKKDVPVAISADEPREVRELKQIVNGMRQELRGYLAEGGTFEDYLRDLNSRQIEEEQIYERVRSELEGNPDPEVFKARNEQLRAMGLRTIPKPKK